MSDSCTSCGSELEENELLELLCPLGCETQPPQQNNAEAVRGGSGNGDQLHYTNGNGRVQRPSHFDWTYSLSHLLEERFTQAIQKHGAVGRATFNFDTIRAELESLRNQPNNFGTHDPEGLSETEIQEDLDFLARQYADKYDPPKLEEPTPPPTLPALIAPNIEILSGKDFAAIQRNKTRSWLVEGFLARQEISLWSGKVEHGKTTLIRTLVMCMLRGEFFLERHVYPGRVLYVMLDADGPALTYELFTKMGLDWDNDPIDLLIDPVMALRPNSFQQFHGKLLSIKPDLVVIDPIGRFKKIEQEDGGFNGYGMTYAMAEFSELAKQTNCHMVLLHHIPRGRSDNDDPATAGFGSVAIAGGCNARFSCIKKAGNIYVVKTSQGKGGGFIPFEGEMRLERNPDTEWVTLAGTYDWKDQARAVKPLVRDLINLGDKEWTSDGLGRELRLQRSVAGLAAKMLAEDGEIAIRQEGQRNYFRAKEFQFN